jgi:uncharacterized protein YbjQ (UPF0145 family)
VPPRLLQAPAVQSCELLAYTHALYDARELAIERLQDEAEALGATAIVGVTVSEKHYSWRANRLNIGNAALQTGEITTTPRSRRTRKRSSMRARPQ